MPELGRSDDADMTVARPSTAELFTPVEAADYGLIDRVVIDRRNGYSSSSS